MALPVGTRLLVRARAQDPQNGLMREPATALRVVGGRSVGGLRNAGRFGAGGSA